MYRMVLGIGWCSMVLAYADSAAWDSVVLAYADSAAWCIWYWSTQIVLRGAYGIGLR